MKELLAFQDWAIEKGHYQTVAALKRYFKLLESDIERTSDTSEDNEVSREQRLPNDEDDNDE